MYTFTLSVTPFLGGYHVQCWHTTITDCVSDDITIQSRPADYYSDHPCIQGDQLDPVRIAYEWMKSHGFAPARRFPESIQKF